MFNEFPYTNYEKINLDWLLDLGNKLKADAESGEFDGERGHGIFGITTIYSENNQYYAINPGGATVGDFILGYGSAAGTNILYIMKVTSVTGNYVNGTSITRITGPMGEPGPQGEPGEGVLTVDTSLSITSTNPVQNRAITEALNTKYAKPNGGIPKSDLASSVQTSLDKAETALQTAPVISVNGQTGNVSLIIPRVAADVGAIPAPSSPAAGQFLVYNGTSWVARTLATWQGGSY